MCPTRYRVKPARGGKKKDGERPFGASLLGKPFGAAGKAPFALKVSRVKNSALPGPSVPPVSVGSAKPIGTEPGDELKKPGAASAVILLNWPRPKALEFF